MARRHNPADNEALHRLAARALVVGYRTAWGITSGNQQLSEDVAQDVAVKALRAAPKLRDDADAWLHRAAYTTTMDHLRRRGRQQRADTEFAQERDRLHDAHAAAELDPAELDPQLQAVADLLAPLTERQRAAMTLRYVHDLDDEQIAHALGCRAVTVRSLISRAAATLRAATELPATPEDDPR